MLCIRSWEYNACIQLLFWWVCKERFALGLHWLRCLEQLELVAVYVLTFVCVYVMEVLSSWLLDGGGDMLISD